MEHPAALCYACPASAFNTREGPFVKQSATASRLVTLVALLLFAPLCPGARADESILQALRDCSLIAGQAERLQCFDALAGRAENGAQDGAEAPAAALEVPEPPESYLAKQWDLDETGKVWRFTIMPHRDNYILPYSRNRSPNPTPAEGVNAVQNVQKTEVKYQLSLKTKLWPDIFDQPMDLWFGYTQQSYWQLYNLDESSPFRETNYEPELLLNFRTRFNLLGMQVRSINLGLNHQSNGRSEPLSRSWNRLVANAGLERGNFTLLLKSWYRIPESKTDDDNRDIDDYLGPGELWGYYLWHRHRFGVMLRNNFQTHDNRTSVQLDWTLPLTPKTGLYLHYFNGYGENLIDYDQHANRVGAGIILTDW